MRPFPYDRLQRLTSAQVMLLDRISILSREGKYACTALEPVLGAPLEISAREIRPANAERRLGVGSQLVVIEHAGSGATILVELDTPLALEMIWKCLAGSIDASVATPRPLDQVEEGVLLYIASRALWSLWGRSSPFRVVGIGSAADLEELGGEGALLHLLLSSGPLRGHAWLHVSAQLGSVLDGNTGPLVDTTRTAFIIDDLPAALHVVLGRTELTAAQWLAVGLGDVIVIDEVWARPDAETGGFFGELRLRLPLGCPRWQASLDREQKLEITGLFNEKQGAIMDQADDQLPVDGGDTLQEIPLELSVELGRVRTTAQGVLDLRPGQTLRLGRRPGDAVDLRLGPKLIARGELVEVDGELGVLLRELFRE